MTARQTTEIGILLNFANDEELFGILLRYTCGIIVLRNEKHDLMYRNLNYWRLSVSLNLIFSTINRPLERRLLDQADS